VNSQRRGLLYVLLGAIAFSLGGLFVKLMPWNAMSVSGGRCIFSSLVIYLYIRLSGHKPVFNRTVFLGALFVSAMLVCYVTSMKYTTAANAIVLEYTAPIFIIFFEAVLFHKKPGKLDLAVSAAVFAGILIVVSDGLGKGNLKGDVIALLSGIFYAFTIMLNEFEGSDPLTSVWLGHVLTIFIGLPSVWMESDFSLPTLGLLAALGIFQAGFGYSLLTAGLRLCEPLPGSLVASIEPVLNPILVAVFYKEYVSAKTLFGAAVVIASIVIYNILSAKMKKDEVK